MARTPDDSLVPKVYEGKNDKAQHGWRAQAVDLLRVCLVAISQSGHSAEASAAAYAAAIKALEETLQRLPGQRWGWFGGM